MSLLVMMGGQMARALAGGEGAAGYPYPPGWAWALPFNIEYVNGVFQPSNSWDVSSLAPTGKAYYFSQSGSDAADGLTLGTAKRNLYSAPGDIVVAYLTAGLWGYTNNFRGAYAATLMAVIGLGAVTYSNDLGLYTSWTDLGASFSKATTSDVGDVWDSLNLDVDGNYSKYTNVVDAATCETTPGSWYNDTVGNVLYVHCSDARTPDSNIHAIIGGSIGLKPSGKTPFYFENINFIFNSGTGRPFRAFGNGDAASRLYCKNCSVNYSTSAFDLWDIDGIGTIIMQGCSAKMGPLDAFNYHEQSSVIPKVIEINCQGNYVGVAGGDTQNCSSIHDAGTILRLEGEYHHSHGPVIADVNNCRSWNLGVYAHHSQANTGSSKANYYLDATPAGSIMWMDNCQGSDSAIGRVCLATTTIYTRAYVDSAADVITGTLTAY